MYQTNYDSPIGTLVLVSDGKYLYKVCFPMSSYVNLEYLVKDDLEVFIKTRQWLDNYFSGKKPEIDIPIKFIGTDFQKRVWNLLLEIPYGTIVTYKDIARKISDKMSCQAIGTAIAKNPIGILVPCHRVVGYNNLGGFSGGIDNKRYLLKHEGVNHENCSL